ncbi:MAG: hypothetical protein JRN59_03305 [Nitrososphaerota archaeon]|nr:hypothetical protein [Nitrososphaerota archaeon]
MSSLLVVALAWFHVLFAAVWIGSAILFIAVLGPVVSVLSPQSRSEFMARFLPRMEAFLNYVVPMLLASGAALFVAMSWGAPLLLDTWTLSVAVGGVLGLATYLYALVTLVPASRRLAALIRNGGPVDRIVTTQRALGRASTAELVLMLLTFTAMVAAGLA